MGGAPAILIYISIVATVIGVGAAYLVFAASLLVDVVEVTAGKTIAQNYYVLMIA